MASWVTDATRHVYVVAASGKVRINGHTVNARDGVAIADEASITVEASEDAELVMVDSR